jgi:hypothetical protein
LGLDFSYSSGFSEHALFFQWFLDSTNEFCNSSAVQHPNYEFVPAAISALSACIGMVPVTGRDLIFDLFVNAKKVRSLTF